MHRYITYLFPLRQTGGNDTPIATSILSTQNLVFNFIIQRKKPGSLEKWQILGLGKEIRTISLEHLTVPESKDVLKNKKGWRHGQVTGGQPSRALRGQSWNTPSKKINKGRLDCNSKHYTNIQESILM